MGKWDEFNKSVNMDELNKQKKEIESGAGTGNFAEVPAGRYRVKCEKLEVGETSATAKNPNAPILKAMFRIIGGQYKKQCLFYNRTLYAANPSDKWNTERAIAVAIGWLETLEPSEDINVTFVNYDQFSDMVLDVAEDVADLEYEIDYDPDEFNNITVTEVFE